MDESARSIAHLFSWSLAGSFFLLDMMTVSHRGWKVNLGRMVKGGQIQWAPTLCTVGVLALIVATAALPAWITNLELPSVAGCVIIFAQVLLRTMGTRYFPVSQRAMNAAFHWPNVTEARSVAHHDA